MPFYLIRKERTVRLLPPDDNVMYRIKPSLVITGSLHETANEGTQFGELRVLLRELR